MNITITTFNGRISTVGVIRKNGNGYSAAITQNYTNGEIEVLQAKDYKSETGAKRFIEQYRAKKRKAYQNNELVAGVIVL